MESYIPISFLNDFSFCPRSIYNHQLYKNFYSYTYKEAPQLWGSAAHDTIDNKTYSHSKDWLMALDIFSTELNVCGKIDLYNKKTGILRERKRSITRIYDGFYFQVYAQYFCLEEMGYQVNSIQLYDIQKNKMHAIELPEKTPSMLAKFYLTLKKLKEFDLNAPFKPEKSKCKTCIYFELCDQSLC
jgi:CRISPR-associated exonuclease Cas4